MDRARLSPASRTDAQTGNPERWLERIPRVVWIGVLALLLVRVVALAASVPMTRPLTGDETIYDAIARSLLAGEGYWYNGAPWVWKPPGWPIVLAGLYATLGTAVRTTVIAQGLFDAGTILVLSWLAGRIHGSRLAAGIAFALLLTWPPLLREARFIQTEPLFTMLTAVLLATFMRFSFAPTWRSALLAGAVAGVTSLVRPPGIVLIVGMVVAWLVTLRGSRVVAIRAALPLLAGLVLVITPWAARNAARFHAFIPISTGGAELFYMGTTPETDGRWDNRQWPALAEKALGPVRERLGRPLDPIERDRAFLAAGLANWQRDPAGSLRITAKRALRLCFVPFDPGDRPWLRLGFLAAIAAIYLFATRAVLRGTAPPGIDLSPRVIPWITALVFALASTMFYTSSRYFEPIRPMLIMLASIGIADMLDSRRDAARAPGRRRKGA